MKKILDIALNDMLHNFRSLFAIGMMFAAPLLITGLIYFAFGVGTADNSSMQPVKVVVVNLDRPTGNKEPVSKSLVDMLNDDSVSSWLQASPATDEAAARAAIESQQAGVAVIIPENLTQVVGHGKGSAQVRILQDPTLSTGPAVIKNMTGMFVDGINGIQVLSRLAVDHMLTSTVPVDASAMLKVMDGYTDWFKDYQRALFHTSSVLEVQVPATGTPVSGSDGAAGNVARIMGTVLAGQMLFFAFYTGAYSMMSVLREDEQGTLARLFTTPTSGTVILAGKFLAVVLMVLVQSGVMLAVGALAFKIYWGQPLSILLAVVGQVAAASGLGVLLISFVKTSKQAGPVLGGGLTALGMLGGLFTSNVAMPEGFTCMAFFTPQGWAINGWKLALAGSPASELALTCAVCALTGVVMFAAGAAIFRRRYA